MVCWIFHLYGNTPLPNTPTRQRGIFIFVCESGSAAVLFVYWVHKASLFTDSAPDLSWTATMVRKRGVGKANTGYSNNSKFDNPQFLWRGTQVVRERSAKPLCAGSIPARASSPFNILEQPQQRGDKAPVAEIAATPVFSHCIIPLQLSDSAIAPVTRQSVP